jgi:hypothetical protein
VVIRLTPRLLSDDMIGLKQVAIAGTRCPATFVARMFDQEHSGVFARLAC